jgi:TRAP transporter TAXI family solute receptor
MKAEGYMASLHPHYAYLIYASAAVLLPTMASAQTIDQHVCTKPNTDERRVLEVHYLSDREVPCRVFYVIGDSNRQIYRAEHEPGVCEDNAQKVIARLEANGWNCQQSARDGMPPSVSIIPQGSGSSDPAAEQSSIPTKSPTFAAPFPSNPATRERINAAAVGVISGGIHGTDIRIAADLAAVLDDTGAGDEGLHVLPVLGDGSIQNLSDMMHLPGIDIGIVQSDVLAYARREQRYSILTRQLRYVARLYNQEFHLLAGRGIRSIEDLAGRRVNVDVRGSGTSITASLVFDMLRIGIDPVNFDQELAVQKLRSGDIAALAYVSGKPTELFRDLDGSDGLHFLALPLTDAMLDAYLPTSLTAADYPRLIPESTKVETVATGAIMVVYNWKRDTDRYRKVAHFIDAFFSSIEEFHQPARHPKWQEVNLTARIPDCERFDVAETWLRRAGITDTGNGDQASREAFQTFIQERAGQTGQGSPTAEQADALFQKFLRWRNQHDR